MGARYQDNSKAHLGTAAPHREIPSHMHAQAQYWAAAGPNGNQSALPGPIRESPLNAQRVASEKLGPILFP